jgi:hypothetical protein
MILSIDHQQRLNLIALMGAQRANVAEMRMFWALQDKLDLNADEKETIGYRIATDPSGIEIPSWNRELKLPPKEFEVSEAEGQRLRKIIEEWPHFLTAMDRAWIVPLLDQLPQAAPQAAPQQVRM